MRKRRIALAIAVCSAALAAMTISLLPASGSARTKEALRSQAPYPTCPTLPQLVTTTCDVAPGTASRTFVAMEDAPVTPTSISPTGAAEQMIALAGLLRWQQAQVVQYLTSESDAAQAQAAAQAAAEAQAQAQQAAAEQAAQAQAARSSSPTSSSAPTSTSTSSGAGSTSSSGAGSTHDSWWPTAICEEGGSNSPTFGYFGILPSTWQAYHHTPDTAGDYSYAEQEAVGMEINGGPPDAPGQCHSW